MDPRIAVVLIIMGTLLVMTPPASDYLIVQEVATSRSGLSSLRNSGALMDDDYRMTCAFLGGVMIATGVVCAGINWRRGSRE